jgi:hypothetical protein
MIKMKGRVNIGAIVIALVIMNVAVDIVYDKVTGRSDFPITYAAPVAAMTESDYKEKGELIMSKLSNGLSENRDLPEAVQEMGGLSASLIKVNYLKMEALLSTKKEITDISEGITNQISVDMKKGITYEDYRDAFFDKFKNEI